MTRDIQPLPALPAYDAKTLYKGCAEYPVSSHRILLIRSTPLIFETRFNLMPLRNWNVSDRAHQQPLGGSNIDELVPDQSSRSAESLYTAAIK